MARKPSKRHQVAAAVQETWDREDTAARFRLLLTAQHRHQVLNDEVKRLAGELRRAKQKAKEAWWDLSAKVRAETRRQEQLERSANVWRYVGTAPTGPALPGAADPHQGQREDAGPAGTAGGVDTPNGDGRPARAVAKRKRRKDDRGSAESTPGRPGEAPVQVQEGEGEKAIGKS